MNQLKDVGYVIRRRNLGDSDKFITVFTKNHGKIEVLAKGVRRINSRRSSHIELLNLIQFQANKTKKNFILTDVSVVDTSSKLKESYHHIGKIFLICELIDKLCPHNLKHDDIFELIKNTIDELKKSEDSSLLNFQIDLLVSLGFWDKKRQFHDERDIDRYIESLIERKIKTKTVFKI